MTVAELLQAFSVLSRAELQATVVVRERGSPRLLTVSEIESHDLGHVVLVVGTPDEELPSSDHAVMLAGYGI